MSIIDMEEEVKQLICKVKIKLENKEIDFKLIEDLQINYQTMELEMDKYPQIYGLWAYIMAEHKEQLEVVEKQIKLRKALLINEILTKDNGTKLRRTDIMDIIELDDDLKILEAKYIIMSKIHTKLHYTLKALEMKVDVSRSLMGIKKMEMR